MTCKRLVGVFPPAFPVFVFPAPLTRIFCAKAGFFTYRYFLCSPRYGCLPAPDFIIVSDGVGLPFSSFRANGMMMGGYDLLIVVRMV